MYVNFMNFIHYIFISIAIIRNARFSKYCRYVIVKRTYVLVNLDNCLIYVGMSKCG